jgi:hypothetical protein
MAVMIFVNDLASVKGLPWWTYHMNARVSGMTYVDVVFPAFLFVLGMSIPLATNRRLDRGGSMAGLWWHILSRSLSLVVLGLAIANEHKVDASATGLQPGAWGSLALMGGILFWLVYPSESGNRRLFTVLRWTGFAMLVAMLAIFRRTKGGELAWLDFRYWEILGLIGRAYLAACIVYIPLRRRAWAPAAMLAVFTAWNIGTRLGLPRVTTWLPYWLWPFDAGELPSIVLAGIVCTSIFVEKRAIWTFPKIASAALGYAAVLFACGWACTPLRISKNAATPAWCLYSAGISVLLFLAIYYLVDVQRWQAWSAFVRPAGSNTLLTYLVPDLFYFLFGTAYAAGIWSSGGWGVLRSVVFTASVLGVSAVLTKSRIRMQL